MKIGTINRVRVHTIIHSAINFTSPSRSHSSRVSYQRVAYYFFVGVKKHEKMFSACTNYFFFFMLRFNNTATCFVILIVKRGKIKHKKNIIVSAKKKYKNWTIIMPLKVSNASSGRCLVTTG